MAGQRKRKGREKRRERNIEKWKCNVKEIQKEEGRDEGWKETREIGRMFFICLLTLVSLLLVTLIIFGEGIEL
jgi:flagellar biosynthesis/type III secretory pathway protein FliH